MDSKTILGIVMAAVEAELESYKDDLTEAQKEQAATCAKYLAEEMLALAMAQDEQKKDYHRKNIVHYQAALLSISAIMRIRAYNSTINVIGRVLAGIAIATGKALV